MRNEWPQVALLDVCEAYQPKTITRKEMATDGSYPVYGANGLIGRYHEFNHDQPEVLLGCRGSCGSVNMSEPKSWITGNAMVIKPRDDRIARSFIRYWLGSIDLRDIITGVAQPQITRKSLSSLRIPVPKLAEQKRIVAILDEAFEAIERAEAAYTSSLDVVSASMSRFFTQLVPAAGRPSWTRATIADVTVQRKGAVRTGPFGSQLLHSEFVDEGIRVLGIDNAVQNEFAWDQIRCITEAKYEGLRRYTVHPGDVIITIMGTCGRCAVIPSDISTSITSKHLCCITLDQQLCLPEFLKLFFLKHPMARQHLAAQTRGAIMDGLNMTIIKSVPLMLPPVEEQAEIVERLSRFQSACADLLRVAAARRERCDELRGSLLATAFRGELGQGVSRDASLVGAAS